MGKRQNIKTFDVSFITLNDTIKEEETYINKWVDKNNFNSTSRIIWTKDFFIKKLLVTKIEIIISGWYSQHRKRLEYQVKRKDFIMVKISRYHITVLNTNGLIKL